MSDRNVMKERVDKALEIAGSYGQIDGDHHKLWTIDQMVRALLGDPAAYDAWVDMHNGPPNEDGATEYMWETGIAP